LTRLSGFSQFDHLVTTSLNSAVLHEPRKIQVYSPTSSDTGKHTYPVLYVLDAESLFLATVSASGFMNHSSSLTQMPEAIIVGICQEVEIFFCASRAKGKL
jgi:predicted alpha/beta superfamily hydrolase